MEKKQPNFDRLEKGEVMYFISSLSFGVVATRDEYFPTDDDRYFDGNYFPDAKLAHACSEEIIEIYVPRLTELKKQQRDNHDKYFTATKKLADSMKKKMKYFVQNKDKEDAKPAYRWKTGDKPDFESFAVDLVDVYTSYKDVHDALIKAIADVNKEIKEFIRVYPK